MKKIIILLMVLFMSLPIILLGQNSFDKTQKVHAYLIEGRIADTVESAFRERSNVTFISKKSYSLLNKKELENRKVIKLYEHVINDEVKQPSGNIGIWTKGTEIPANLPYRRLLKSNLIVIDVLNSPYKSLEEAYEKLKEKQWVEKIQIGYTNNFKVNSDTYYPQQYYLNNTGQFGGTPGIDINVERAWEITKGTSNLKVAVIDQGLEDHEDLEDSNGNSRIVDGYTPATGGGGSPYASTDSHGIACAGILAASHNEDLIRGVSPNVELLGVNIFYPGTDEFDIADGIEWAVDNGAKILSSSWGFTTTNIVDPVDDAIDYAINNDVVVVLQLVMMDMLVSQGIIQV